MQTRRRFIQGLAGMAGVAALGAPMLALGASPRIVVVGGGTGGATAARFVKRNLPSAQVTLIEREASYVTCYMSNEVLGGGRELESLRQGYDGLRAAGVVVIRDEVTGIDAGAREISTSGGRRIGYERAIVAPGIDFRWELIDGYDATVAEDIPHAWKAGPQTLTLRAQLQAMDDGGTVVIGAPPNPYRCPPAPYERASQIALYLRRNKPASKVVLLDPKPGFAKQALFEQAWSTLYGYGPGGMIERLGAESEAGVVALNPDTREVVTAFGDRFRADVLNIIPPQKAGPIAFTAGLTDDSGWCPVDPLTFESRLVPNVHVIGDACTAPSLPKSGYAANSEAKACAAAVAALSLGREIPAPSFSNACYSIVGDAYAISILGIYRLADDGRSIQAIPGAGGATPLDASERQLRVDVDYAYSWYENFTREIFG